MTLSDLIVSYLETFGVKQVFSVPGTPLSPLYDALVRSQQRGGARSVLTRHENGAVFMADGYARETGRIGVCCATTGPGTTNLITGVATAYTDHVPILVISAQTALPHFGLGSFQESSADAINVMAMFDPCTRYNSLVTHPEQLERKLTAALITALQTPNGPVHLSIPTDILRLPSPKQPSFPNLHRLVETPTAFIDKIAIEKLWQTIHTVLKQKRKLVLLLGHDCRGATKELKKFAELTNTSILTTQRGKTWIEPYHPLVKGVFGFAGHTSARQALMDDTVDLILAVGTNLCEWSTGGWDTALLNEKLVHIHNTTDYFFRSQMAQLQVCGTINTVFQTLIEKLETHIIELQLVINKSFHYVTESCIPPQIEVRRPQSYLPHSEMIGIKAQNLYCELVQRFPPETRFLIDNSNSVPMTIHYLFPRQYGTYHLSTGFAPMGWAIGAAVGVAFSDPQIPTVCITGDGCFLMSGQEITVAVAERLPVIFVVLNDFAFGMIKHGHRLVGKEPVNFTIPPVDFCAMAKAVGANAYKIQTSQDFEQLNYTTLVKDRLPTLIEVLIDPEEESPLSSS